MNFSDELILWYSEHKRDLPWRKTKDPYKIWLSEVILQQTRVDQGRAYYERFLLAFPTVSSLASAKEEAVLKLWQGLGYYSRARNLRKTAIDIVKNHKAKFPASYEALLQLKGIGPYTAAAIASFAFNKKHAVVDGNVYRVLSRVFGIEEAIDSSHGKKLFAALANELIPEKNPSEFNQAIMEFGAIQCTPKLYDCQRCCMQTICVAFNKKIQSRLPIKLKKTKQRERFFHYLVLQYKSFTFIHRRGEGDIWQGLYEFPLIETLTEKPTDGKEMNDQMVQLLGTKNFRIEKIIDSPKHVLSHQVLRTKFLIVHIDKLPEKKTFTSYKKVPIADLGAYAWPRLIEKFLEKELV